MRVCLVFVVVTQGFQNTSCVHWVDDGLCGLRITIHWYAHCYWKLHNVVIIVTDNTLCKSKPVVMYQYEVLTQISNHFSLVDSRALKTYAYVTLYMSFLGLGLVLLMVCSHPHT